MKPAILSKLNWLGLAMTMIGLWSDPIFQGYLADCIPPDILPRVLSIGGMVVMVIRTFFTSQGLTLGKGASADGP